MGKFDDFDLDVTKTAAQGGMSYIDYQYGRRCERKRRKRICC